MSPARNFAMNANSYMHSILWCCSSCGFVLEGGQPTMECPICEAYKSAFIDTPAHVEAELRNEFGDLHNGAEGRAARLTKLREGGFLKNYRVKGRFTIAVNGSTESRKFV